MGEEMSAANKREAMRIAIAIRKFLADFKTLSRKGVDVIAPENFPHEGIAQIVQHEEYQTAARAGRRQRKAPLYRADIAALKLVGDGADITGFELATHLREIQRKRPELITICSAMGVYKRGEHHPYLGAKLTAAGMEAIK